MGHSKPDVSVPPDLSALEYARHIIEFELGWPQKSNTEMIADCIKGIASKKSLTLVKAYKYLARAILLARENGVEINRLFFLDGVYMNVRPKESKLLPMFKPMTAEEKRALAEDQASPEWQECRRKLDAMFKSWSQAARIPEGK